MDATTLNMIRTAIGDPSGSPTYSDEEIADIFETVNNRKATIGFFLLAKAIALTEPTAPTLPTIPDNPESSFGYWDKKAQHDLSLYSHALSLYRDKLSHIRQMADLYKAQASIFLDEAKGGDYS